jgi:hypothetical protein
MCAPVAAVTVHESAGVRCARSRRIRAITAPASSESGRADLHAEPHAAPRLLQVACGAEERRERHSANVEAVAAS